MIRRRRGFTLIELIIVMVIIGILAGLIVSAGMAAKRRAAITKARAAIAGLESAIGKFYLDIGMYPSGAPASTTNSNLILCIDATSGAVLSPVTGVNAWMTTAQLAAWSGPYIELQASDIDGASNYLDPWRRPYRYHLPGTNHGAGANYINYFDLYSLGPDGVTATDGSDPDDINNWRR